MRFPKTYNFLIGLLRMVHGFCQSMPMLLLQSYLLLKTNTNQNDINNQKFLKLIRISIGLSLVSISWSLASFSKNVRLHKVHKLILTWLGVIIQVYFSYQRMNRYPNFHVQACRDIGLKKQQHLHPKSL